MILSPRFHQKHCSHLNHTHIVHTRKGEKINQQREASSAATYLVIERAENHSGAAPLAERERMCKEDAAQEDRQKLPRCHDGGEDESAILYYRRRCSCQHD